MTARRNSVIMERELFSLCEVTKKAALVAAMDSISFTGPEVSRCVGLPKKLKDFPVTGNVLVSTTAKKKTFECEMETGSRKFEETGKELVRKSRRHHSSLIRHHGEFVDEETKELVKPCDPVGVAVIQTIQMKPERLINMSLEEMASDERQCEIRKRNEKVALMEQMAEKISEEKPEFDEVKWLESLW
ncbi:hypothetical protein Patl1_27780 [Pistacia atlantica]|uniref:Uncharacterized protein n=1 Tax=Pistacia atlantica TaxID=434234 RepID=A0ACC1BH15_9ROSI|nr:hypothetical protein Patl1_27780 [Pistacia atlantica]